ncbi:hypothetical protein [Pseudomonas sp. S2_H10]
MKHLFIRNLLQQYDGYRGDDAGKEYDRDDTQQHEFATDGVDHFFDTVLWRRTRASVVRCKKIMDRLASKLAKTTTGTMQISRHLLRSERFISWLWSKMSRLPSP